MPENPGPLVSVIVPVYNSEAYLRQCLDSILQQSYRPLEILIGEDASPDRRVADIVRDYAARHPDIIRAFFHEQNLGAIGNMNFMTARANGDYIVNFAGDDVMLPGKIKKAVYYLESHPEYALCHHDCIVFQDQSQGQSQGQSQTQGDKTLYHYSQRFPLRSGNLEDFIAGRFYVATNTVMFKKIHLPDPVLDSELGNPSDWDFVARYMEKANSSIGYIPEKLAKYRRHGLNLSSHKNSDIYDQQMLAIEKWLLPVSKYKNAARIGMAERSFSYAILAIKNPAMFSKEKWRLIFERMFAAPLGIGYGILNIMRYMWANFILARH